MYNYTSYEDDYNYPAVEYRYTCKYMYVYSIWIFKKLKKIFGKLTHFVL